MTTPITLSLTLSLAKSLSLKFLIPIQDHGGTGDIFRVVKVIWRHRCRDRVLRIREMKITCEGGRFHRLHKNSWMPLNHPIPVLKLPFYTRMSLTKVLQLDSSTPESSPRNTRRINHTLLLMVSSN